MTGRRLTVARRVKVLHLTVVQPILRVGEHVVVTHATSNVITPPVADKHQVPAAERANAIVARTRSNGVKGPTPDQKIATRATLEPLNRRRVVNPPCTIAS